ncbi:antibiotic biosynthesis monooxygenase [bacterium CPR1]|nr:antibiotic biosynthesis monooxygenase [bacterium CPR1]
MIHVTANIEVQPGKEEDLVAAMAAVVGPTRAEEGCLEYHLHRSPEVSTRFLMIERWASPEALAAHLQTPHIKALFAQAPQIVAAPVAISSWIRVEI